MSEGDCLTLPRIPPDGSGNNVDAPGVSNAAVPVLVCRVGGTLPVEDRVYDVVGVSSWIVFLWNGSPKEPGYIQNRLIRMNPSLAIHSPFSADKGGRVGRQKSPPL